MDEIEIIEDSVTELKKYMQAREENCYETVKGWIEDLEDPKPAIQYQIDMNYDEYDQTISHFEDEQIKDLIRDCIDKEQIENDAVSDFKANLYDELGIEKLQETIDYKLDRCTGDRAQVELIEQLETLIKIANEYLL